MSPGSRPDFVFVHLEEEPADFSKRAPRLVLVPFAQAAQLFIRQAFHGINGMPFGVRPRRGTRAAGDLLSCVHDRLLLREVETRDTINLPEAAAMESVLLLTGEMAIQPSKNCPA